MQRPRAKSRRRREPGFIITLVAVFLLFVVGAMAALSIDVVTFYTARSEAQLAADAAALAGARVLANSGMTSSTDATLASSAVVLCQNVGKQVGASNQVGGQNIAGQITVTCAPAPQGNPTVRTQVQVTVPAFFARIWGTRQVTVTASATAEAYNPSGGLGTSNTTAPPVAPFCVKPWLLPNRNPSGTGPIFDSSGNPADPNLLGSTPAVPLTLGCTSPSGVCGLPASPAPWAYLVGDDITFSPPTNALPSCSPALTSNYQASIAGCVQIPISCNQKANIDISSYSSANWNLETANAVNCLTHATNATSPGGGDSVIATSNPTAPFQFIVGSENPLALVTPSLVGSNALVSDSLVTVPVFDNGGAVLANNNQLVGFVQLFLNSDGNQTPASGQVITTVVNLVGCVGLDTSAQPVIGNGASPVAVRLITQP